MFDRFNEFGPKFALLSQFQSPFLILRGVFANAAASGGGSGCEGKAGADRPGNLGLVSSNAIFATSRDRSGLLFFADECDLANTIALRDGFSQAEFEVLELTTDASVAIHGNVTQFVE